MGEIRLFQICYEGDLTAEVSHVMRRLGADANFDQSWQVFLPEGRHSAALVRERNKSGWAAARPVPIPIASSTTTTMTKKTQPILK